MEIETISRVCHEANRALCEAHGDCSQPRWDDAPPWQKDSTKTGVEWRLKNLTALAGAQHDQWMQEKLAEGWVRGKVKDDQAKTHPLLIPFDQLSPEQQAKDRLFASIVSALAP